MYSAGIVRVGSAVQGRDNAMGDEGCRYVLMTCKFGDSTMICGTSSAKEVSVLCFGEMFDEKMMGDNSYIPC